MNVEGGSGVDMTGRRTCRIQSSFYESPCGGGAGGALVRFGGKVY
jgi:hypothetical protein